MKTHLISLCTIILAAIASAQEKRSFASIVELPSRYLIGGHANGRWLDSATIGKRLAGTTSMPYRVFTLKGELKNVIAGETTPDEDLAPDLWMQKITSELDLEEQAIGVSAPWNPMPRKAKLGDVNQEKYVSAVRDLLISKGIAKPKVKITQLLRVDLEGDGEDEVLISATNYVNEAELISAKAGDYSFVAPETRRFRQGADPNRDWRIPSQVRCERPPEHIRSRRPVGSGWRWHTGSPHSHKLLRRRRNAGLAIESRETNRRAVRRSRRMNLNSLMLAGAPQLSS